MPFSRRLFYWISTVVVPLYRRFPIFGALRGSVGIVRRGDLFLVVDRSDRRGLCFPGGMAMPWETDATVLVREMQEETGLTVTDYRFLFRYLDHFYFPGRISVFEIEAEGEVRGSWEGDPLWVTLNELAPRLFPMHRRIYNYLTGASA